MALAYPDGIGLGQGKNPIAPSGSVHINGCVSLPAQKDCQYSLMTGQSAIGGSHADEHWSVNHGDVVVTLRPDSGYPHPITGKNDPNLSTLGSNLDISTYILPCANGFGKKGESREKMNEALWTVAVATGRRDGNSERGAVALRIGGLATIKNTGPQMIRQGDEVLVSAPDPSNERTFGYSRAIPASRVPWWTVPNNDFASFASISVAYKIFTSGKPDPDFPISSKFAYTLAYTVLHSSFVAILAAVRVGVVKIGDPKSENMFRQLNQDEISYFGKVLKSDDFSSYIFKSVIAEEEQFLLFKPTVPATVGGGAKYEFTWMEEIVDSQKNSYKKLLASFTSLQLAERRRTLGVALTNAAPGQDFDIILKSGQ
jgi:hypothetical protein